MVSPVLGGICPPVVALMHSMQSLGDLPGPPPPPSPHVNATGAVAEAINEPGEALKKGENDAENLKKKAEEEAERQGKKAVQEAGDLAKKPFEAPKNALDHAIDQLKSLIRQWWENLEAQVKRDLIIAGLIMVAVLIVTSFLGNLLALKVAQRRSAKG
jgi:hypothetical protein